MNIYDDKFEALRAVALLELSVRQDALGSQSACYKDAMWNVLSRIYGMATMIKDETLSEKGIDSVERAMAVMKVVDKQSDN